MLKVLGIESSCDETAVAIVSEDCNILSHNLYSQVKEHEIHGGVIPELAARNHLHHINNLILKSLQDASLTLNDIDAFSATAGPGLVGGLITGTIYAKTMGMIYNKPFIAVNHLQGHALVAKLENLPLKFPYLLLLISGGHTQFIAVLDVLKYEILGETIDDALGECFDKVARVLGFSYPGGAKIEEVAKIGNELKYTFPKPLQYSNNCNFSFSGLKTSVNNFFNSALQGVTNKEIKQELIADIAASFQFTIAKLFDLKTKKAIDMFIKKYNQLPTAFIPSGGVASNLYLQSKLKSIVNKLNIDFMVPSKSLCTDNGVMIAYSALLMLKQGIQHDLSFKINPRWSLNDLSTTI